MQENLNPHVAACISWNMGLLILPRAIKQRGRTQGSEAVCPFLTIDSVAVYSRTPSTIRVTFEVPFANEQPGSKLLWGCTRTTCRALQWPDSAPYGSTAKAQLRGTRNQTVISTYLLRRGQGVNPCLYVYSIYSRARHIDPAGYIDSELICFRNQYRQYYHFVLFPLSNSYWVRIILILARDAHSLKG